MFFLVNQFKFSIILTSYNVEKYLKRTIESVIAQDIGFEENIQLIIVDDGSTDNSLNIIKDYAEEFPDNIVFLTQKNEGVASSRNLGFIYAEGEYVNFLDADDFFSKNTLSDVYSFFELNKESIDLVSIPITYFERKRGGHELNKKTTPDSIIDLKLDPNNPLLSINSSFIKYDALKYVFFDEELLYSEDSLLLNQILLNKNKYGYINSCTYWYRSRNDLTNLLGIFNFNKEYYLFKLKNFHLNLISHCLENFSFIPKYIQYTILYDLFDILKRPEVDFLETSEEKNEFFDLLTEILSYIDDDIISDNRFIDDRNFSLFIFYLKYGNVNYELHPFNVTLYFGDYEADNLNKHNIWIDEFTYKGDHINIKGFINSLFDIKDTTVIAVKEKNGKYDFYTAAYMKDTTRVNTRFLSKDILYSYTFSLDIPTDDLIDSNFRLRFDYHKNGNKLDNRRENLVFAYLNVLFSSRNNLSENFTNYYDDMIISLDNKVFTISRGFKFSVIMAIYNTEKYIKQAIDSIINQTIGFEENIQLILVNDGSTDSTASILEDYEAEYPENITLIHQVNQGQAAARNNGLNYIRSNIVNFLDSDDYLSENAMEEVYKFYKKHGGQIDVVALPLILFGRSNEEHTLNYKFRKTRVIDLNKQPNHPQLHVSSSFIKQDSIKDNRFPQNITGSEDGNFVNNILLRKRKLGVISNAHYFYRKREDGSSTLDTMALKENFYIPRLKDHFLNLIDNSIRKYGKVPKFIQYALIYDLQWLISISELEVYTEKSDINEFWYYINSVIKYIDMDVITKNPNINSGLVRNFLIYLKNKDLHFEIKNNEVFLKTKNHQLDKLSVHNIWLDIVEIDDGYLNISGFLNSLFDPKYLSVDGIKIFDDGTESFFHGNYVKYTARQGIKYLDKVWQYSFTFDLKIPITNNERSKINVVLNYHCDGNNTNYKKFNLLSFNLKLKFLPHVRITQESNYIVKDNHIVYFEDNEFNIIPYSYKSLVKREKIVRDLLNDKKPNDYISMLRLRSAYLLLYPVMRNKKIFLFMDRINNSDDNAEHLFKYANQQKDGIEKYFVLSKSSPDYSRVSKFGKVIGFNSFKHRLLYLFADKVISSHPDESILSPFFSYEKGKDQRKYFNSLVTSGTYFLQHGVTKDNISKWLKKYDKNLKLILTVSDDENDSFLDEGYNYDENIIQPLGFPRFDNLKSNPKNKILIIPTWRNYLEGNKSLFKNSPYFKSLNDLINDERIISLCEEHNYEIIFKPHPKLNTVISEEEGDEKYIDLFEFNDYIKLSVDENYQDLFEKGSLLITDYSSVFFDFAYLKKPVIYYQPNDDYHHEKSYFNYETMGFGDVIDNCDDIIDKIEEYFNNGFEMESKYKDNVDRFFKYIDKNNCQRVYDWIRKN